MRAHGLALGALIALGLATAAIAAETQQDDKSYLPPPSLRAEPGTAQASLPKRISIESRKRSAAVPHRHREVRARRDRRYAGQRLFFSLF